MSVLDRALLTHIPLLVSLISLLFFIVNKEREREKFENVLFLEEREGGKEGRMDRYDIIS